MSITLLRFACRCSCIPSCRCSCIPSELHAARNDALGNTFEQFACSCVGFVVGCWTWVWRAFPFTSHILVCARFMAVHVRLHASFTPIGVQKRASVVREWNLITWTCHDGSSRGTISLLVRTVSGIVVSSSHLSAYN
jgi:hypothetical protein